MALEQAKQILRIVVGIGLIVGAVWGVTDYSLDARTAEIVRAVAVVLLVLWQRYLPAPGARS